jgi:hypothetical protein
MMRRYADYLNNIRRSTLSIDTLCDPHMLCQAPILPHGIPTVLFLEQEGYRTYQGRNSFQTVHDHVMALGMGVFKEMYLHETLGYGKSYLICALVCHLMSIGKRALYTLDCKQLVRDLLQYLEESFRLAFADDTDIVGLLDDYTDTERLVALTKTIAKPSITVCFCRSNERSRWRTDVVRDKVKLSESPSFSTYV